MVIVTLRTLIVFALIIVAVRLMGKRQIGELQPSELVTTILISNLASLPIEDPNLPLITSIVPIFLIVSLEIICSALQLKFNKFSALVSGNAKVVVKNGEIDQKVLTDLRYGVEDLIESLRAKDVFDFNDVSFAIVETNGQLSVFKDENGAKSLPPILVAADGRLREEALQIAGVSRQKILDTLVGMDTALEDVLLMQWQDGKPSAFVRKEKKQ